MKIIFDGKVVYSDEPREKEIVINGITFVVPILEIL
jgi:hypothetical protein